MLSYGPRSTREILEDYITNIFAVFIPVITIVSLLMIIKIDQSVLKAYSANVPQHIF